MTRKQLTLKIECDVTTVLLFTYFVDRALQSVNRAVNVGELPSEIVRLEHDFSAARTGKIVVRLYPSDAFLRFASAVLARDFNLGVINDSSHKETSIKPDIKTRKY